MNKNCINPYDILKLNYNTGDKLWSTAFGEVEFIECIHGIIRCLLDKEIEVDFMSNGILCWWSNNHNCYRYDDETGCAIFPSKENQMWFYNIET